MGATKDIAEGTLSVFAPYAILGAGAYYLIKSGALINLFKKTTSSATSAMGIDELLNEINSQRAVAQAREESYNKDVETGLKYAETVQERKKLEELKKKAEEERLKKEELDRRIKQLELDKQAYSERNEKKRLIAVEVNTVLTELGFEIKVGSLQGYTVEAAMNYRDCVFDYSTLVKSRFGWQYRSYPNWPEGAPSLGPMSRSQFDREMFKRFASCAEKRTIIQGNRVIDPFTTNSDSEESRIRAKHGAY